MKSPLKELAFKRLEKEKRKTERKKRKTKNTEILLLFQP